MSPVWRIMLAEASLLVSIANVDNANASLKQAELELARSLELQQRNSGVVTEQEIDRQTALVASRNASVNAAKAHQEESEVLHKHHESIEGNLRLVFGKHAIPSHLCKKGDLPENQP